jgi:hypothetical protein
MEVWAQALAALENAYLGVQDGHKRVPLHVPDVLRGQPLKQTEPLRKDPTWISQDVSRVFVSVAPRHFFPYLDIPRGHVLDPRPHGNELIEPQVIRRGLVVLAVCGEQEAQQALALEDADVVRAHQRPERLEDLGGRGLREEPPRMLNQLHNGVPVPAAEEREKEDNEYI